MIFYLQGKGTENWKEGKFLQISKKAEIDQKAEDSHPRTHNSKLHTLKHVIYFALSYSIKMVFTLFNMF